MGEIVSDGDPYVPPEPALEAAYAQTPPSLGSEFAARFSESSPTQAVTRWLQRAPYMDTASGAIGRSLLTAGAVEAGASSDDIDQSMKLQPSPTLDADTANKTYGPIGQDGKQVSITDGPIPDAVAKQVGQTKKEELEREAILNRASKTGSWAGNFGMSAAAFMMDPMNAATMLIPGVGEDSVLARMGIEGAGNLAQRLGARAVSGATMGAAGQAPLVALKYALGTEEASDYGKRDAFRDMFYGAAWGSVLQAGVGAFSDLIKARRAPVEVPPLEAPAVTAADEAKNSAAAIISAPPEVNYASMRTAVSQIMSGREVDVLPIFNARAVQAISDRARLSAQALDIDARIAALPPESQTAADRLNRFEAVSQQLTEATDPVRRRALAERRDQILVDTNPEALRAQAAPIEDARRLSAQRDSIQQQLDNIEREQVMSRISHTIPNLPQAAIGQRQIWREGFVQGMPQSELNAFTEEIYGPPKPKEAAPPAKAAEPTKPSPEQEKAAGTFAAALDQAGLKDSQIPDGIKARATEILQKGYLTDPIAAYEQAVKEEIDRGAQKGENEPTGLGQPVAGHVIPHDLRPMASAGGEPKTVGEAGAGAAGGERGAANSEQGAVRPAGAGATDESNALDQQLAEAERELAASGGAIDKDSQAELAETAAGMQSADTQAEAYTQAAMCIKEGGF
jgi:hypothetical protein